MIGAILGRLIGALRGPGPSASERILGYLAEHGERSSSQIGQGLHMWSGPLYPALYALEAEKKIESRWSWPTPLQHPRRRLYRIASAQKGDAP